MPFDDPVLHRTRYGLVFRCACCGRYEIRYLDARLRVTADELAMMRASLRRLDDECDDAERWRITTFTDGEASSVEFDRVDVDRLLDLLGGAEATIELGRILDARAITPAQR